MEFTVRGLFSALSSVNVGSEQMNFRFERWSPNRRTVEFFYRTLSNTKLAKGVHRQLVGLLARCAAGAT